MNFQRVRRGNRGPDITPMIDVIFFLLVFFMVFFTVRTAPLGLNVELPRAVTGNPQASARFEVAVDKTGAMYVSGNKVTSAQLRQALAERLQVNPDMFVIVKADKEVRYEYVVNTLDEIRSAGGYRLGLAVEQDR
ncbi:MAG TPA: biopolymer transporter ExbD [Firmicutes bacterium]|jgi:biopolymer transport protein ExbD|nr:biopolymer transporter ExbD [Bacillota bacterium]